MKIYTKTGDKGITSLLGGKKVSKDNFRIESYGTVDELNSYIGLIRDLINNSKYETVLIEIQDRLFTIGAILATPTDEELNKNKGTGLELSPADIKLLEDEIDAMEENLPIMTNFILPGGHPTVSYCHISRCVCRRAERLTVRLSHDEVIPEMVIQYLNRLSDYLFVLARKLSSDMNAKEIKWIPRK